MTAKFSASADGTKVYLGNASENALELDATGKKIKPVVPFTFDFSSLPFQKSGNGYLTLPNGFILQWGIGAIAPGTVSVALTVPWPTTLLGGFCGAAGPGVSAAFGLAADSVSPLSKISITNNSGSTPQVFWLAIGY